MPANIPATSVETARGRGRLLSATRSLCLAGVCAATLAGCGGGGDGDGGDKIGTSCDDLAAVALPNTVITSTQSVPEGAYTPPGSSAPLSNLPAFCRVTGTTSPAIKFEVWLPQSGWNGKFQGVGNGGTAGVISYAALANGLRRGYAAASTDTGHVSTSGFDASWALNRPDLVADFGHRGTHVMTVNGKEITKTFYGRAPAHAYFIGCSKGGQQALMEAQRYPEDYDGIVGGDPAANWVRFYAGAHLWYAQATLADPESYIPAGKVPLLGNAVNAACDAQDGVADGVLNDPRQCSFDPAVLQCQAGQSTDTCFTPKQVAAIKKIWSGVRNSAGQLVYPGLVPGSENGPGGWAAWVTGSAPFNALHYSAANGFFQNMVFNNPSWDFRTFNYDTDLTLALATVSPHVDAINPDLSAFNRRGGKLIVYHGFSDPDISPLDSIDYYNSVVSRNASAANAHEETQKYFRLFMVPGMQHCSGGPGADQFDALAALERWVEQGEPPARITASKVTNGSVQFTRPLCVYPQLPKYSGTGNVNDAANWTCQAGGTP